MKIKNIDIYVYIYDSDHRFTYINAHGGITPQSNKHVDIKQVFCIHFVNVFKLLGEAVAETAPSKNWLFRDGQV